MEDGVEESAAAKESGNETEEAPESNAADGVSTEPAEAEDGIDGIVRVDTDLGRKPQPRNMWPKRNARVEYEIEGKPVQAKVLSVQPKRNGKNGNWLNVHVLGDDNPRSTGMTSLTGKRSQRLKKKWLY